MITQKLNKIALMAGLSLAIAACGGGGGGGTAAPTSTSASGTAVKGILKGADVSLYKIENGVISTTALATTTTDATGHYNLSGFSYTGPAIIRVKGNTTAKMVCDLAPNCGGSPVVAFGADAPFDSMQEIDVVTTLSAGATTANITPLTHLAAKKAEAGGFSSTAITLANSHIAALFGLTGDISTQAVVDITRPSTNDAAQKAALLGAALFAAAQADGKTLDQVAADIIAANGQLLNSQSTPSTSVTLAEIYGQAADIASTAGSNVSGTVTSAVAAAKTSAESKADQPTTVVPSDTALLAKIDKVKAFTQQIRTLGTTFITDSQANSFKDELTAANTLLSADTKEISKILGYVGDAIVSTSEDRKENPALTSPHMVSYYDYADAPWVEKIIKVEFSGNTYTVTHVSGFANSPLVNLSATVTKLDITDNSPDPICTGASTLTDYGWCQPDDYENSSWGYTHTGGGSVEANLTLSGSVTNREAKLTVLSGSKVVGKVVSTEHETYQDTPSGAPNYNYSSTDSEHNTLSIPNADFDLRVKLGGSGDSDTAVEGQMKFKLASFSNDYTGNWQNNNNGHSGNEKDVFTFGGPTSLDFNGTVTSASGKKVDVVFNFTADGKGIKWTNNATETMQYPSGCYDCYWLPTITESLTSDETNSRYITGSFTLKIDAFLTSNATEKSSITINGSRTGLNKGTANISINYPGGKLLTLASNLEKGKTPVVTVTNQDNVVATLTLADNVTGTIKIGNDGFATISEPNIVKVTYADGTFESLQ